MNYQESLKTLLELLLSRSSFRIRLKPENSNSHGFELHRPSIKSTKQLLKLIKANIIITHVYFVHIYKYMYAEI